MSSAVGALSASDISLLRSSAKKNVDIARLNISASAESSTAGLLCIVLVASLALDSGRLFSNIHQRRSVDLIVAVAPRLSLLCVVFGVGCPGDPVNCRTQSCDQTSVIILRRTVLRDSQLETEGSGMRPQVQQQPCLLYFGGLVVVLWSHMGLYSTSCWVLSRFYLGKTKKNEDPL